jgi:hypothetical protein
MSTIIFLMAWLISFDFPMMSSQDAQSLKVGIKIHPQVHQLTQIMPISLTEASRAMTTFLGNFPSCLKAVNLVYVIF